MWRLQNEGLGKKSPPKNTPKQSPQKPHVRVSLQSCPAVLFSGPEGLFFSSSAEMCWDLCSVLQRPPLVDLNPILGFAGSCLNKAALKQPLPAGAPSPAAAHFAIHRLSVPPSLAQGYCSVSLVPKHSISFHLSSRQWGGSC